MPATRVTIHHEGAGAPSDDVSRFAEGGYTYGIGVTTWTRFRSVRTSFGTLRYNHRSLDICLSGDRDVHPVTDNDLRLIAAATADCRARGEVTGSPDVVPHRNSRGSSTVCPGDLTMARWPEVVAACRVGEPAPKPQPEEEEDEMLIFATNGKPTWLVGGGEPIELDAASLAAVQATGVKLARVSEAVNDRVNAATK